MASFKSLKVKQHKRLTAFVPGNSVCDKICDYILIYNYEEELNKLAWSIPATVFERPIFCSHLS